MISTKSFLLALGVLFSYMQVHQFMSFKRLLLNNMFQSGKVVELTDTYMWNGTEKISHLHKDQDSNCQKSTKTLDVRWEAFSDTQSGINR